MYIYPAAAFAFAYTIFTVQASARSLPENFVDLTSFYHRYHRRIDRIIPPDPTAALSTVTSCAQTRLTTTATAIATASAPTYITASPETSGRIDPAILNHELYRANAVNQATSTSAAAGPTTTTNVDPATWNDQTKSACAKALGGLNGRASNAAGIAACYNIPAVDQSSGVFQADLRLYRISAAAQGWTTVQDQTILVQLYYPAANVTGHTTRVGKRDGYTSSAKSVHGRRRFNLAGRADSTAGPQVLQAFTLTAQIKKEKMGDMRNR